MSTDQLAEDEHNQPPPQSMYYVKATGRLWQITTEILKQLLATNVWRQVHATSNDPFHLLLGDRGRVPYSQLVGQRVPKSLRTHSGGVDTCKIMVNSYRGCNLLTNKSALCKTMRQFAHENNMTVDQLEYLPLTFVIRPGDPTDERKEFLLEYRRQAELIQSLSSTSSSSSSDSLSTRPVKNAWIAKANRGAKGSSIFVSDDADQLIAYIDARATDTELGHDGASRTASVDLTAIANSSSDAFTSSNAIPTPPSTLPSISSTSTPATSLASRAPPLRSRLGSARHSRTASSLAVAASNSWVLQRYIDRPFLIQKRKFDIRNWILVDQHYQIFLYRNGVCRTSSTEFSLDNLSDTFVHLTNHCIQAHHPDFAKLEHGNELFFDQFQTYLDTITDSSIHPRLCVICHLIPQLHRIVRATLASVRPSMESSGDYNSFQLFGYDFMLDERFHLHLLEINATPASAEKLLPELVHDLIHRTIETEFESRPYAVTSTNASSQSRSQSQPQSRALDLFVSELATHDAATILAQPCACQTHRQGRTRQQYFQHEQGDNLFDLVVDSKVTP